jgi:hypothetical protein
VISLSRASSLPRWCSLGISACGVVLGPWRDVIMTILYCGFDEVNMHCFQSHIWRYRPKVEPQFVPFTEMKRNDCSYMFLQPESRTAKRIRWRTSILLRGYVWMWKHLEISNSGRNGHPSKWTMVTMMDSSHAGVLPRHRPWQLLLQSKMLIN